MKRYVVIKIESFEGRDTFLRCGDDAQDHLFAVVVLDESGGAEIIDSGYRTREEALAAWPEAAHPPFPPPPQAPRASRRR